MQVSARSAGIPLPTRGGAHQRVLHTSPVSPNPSACLVASVRSNSRPATYGPRSITRTLHRATAVAERDQRAARQRLVGDAHRRARQLSRRTPARRRLRTRTPPRADTRSDARACDGEPRARYASPAKRSRTRSLPTRRGVVAQRNGRRAACACARACSSRVAPSACSATTRPEPDRACRRAGDRACIDLPARSARAGGP